MRSDILVTGSTGHLGTALMLSLQAEGFCSIGIDILPSQTTSYVGKIQDTGFIKKIFQEHPNIQHIIHCATLHKPHVESHTKQDFIDTNIAGTLALLEAAANLPSGQLQSFLFISTTSTFGSALSPKPGQPAAWINELVTPVPKNIYGTTKVAAEDLCHLIHQQTKIPILVLRTSRFFPEADDDEDRRSSMSDENLKVLELAYRRVDIQDIVGATLCAMKKAKEIGWGKYIISAPSPFQNNKETLEALDRNPEEVFSKLVPEMKAVFDKKGWKCLNRIDRVYDSSNAVADLGWQPKYTFEKTVERVSRGEEWRSELTFAVGKKGYHEQSTGVYTQR